jgi:MoaD family protein
MSVHVKGFLQIKQAMGGRGECDLAMPGTSLDRVLELLSSIYGAHFKALVFDDTGAVRGENSILINGRHYRTLPDGLRTIVADGDNVAIFPPVAGG